MVFSDSEKQIIRQIVREEIDEALEDKLENKFEELKRWLLRECRI